MTGSTPPILHIDTFWDMVWLCTGVTVIGLLVLLAAVASGYLITRGLGLLYDYLRRTP